MFLQTSVPELPPVPLALFSLEAFSLVASAVLSKWWLDVWFEAVSLKAKRQKCCHVSGPWKESHILAVVYFFWTVSSSSGWICFRLFVSSMFDLISFFSWIHLWYRKEEIAGLLSRHVSLSSFCSLTEPIFNDKNIENINQPHSYFVVSQVFNVK